MSTGTGRCCAGPAREWRRGVPEASWEFTASGLKVQCCAEVTLGIKGGDAAAAAAATCPLPGEGSSLRDGGGHNFQKRRWLQQGKY